MSHLWLFRSYFIEKEGNPPHDQVKVASNRVNRPDFSLQELGGEMLELIGPFFPADAVKKGDERHCDNDKCDESGTFCQ